MLHSNHYQKDQTFRAERMREAAREHLAEKVAPRTSIQVRFPRKVVVFALLLGALVAVLLPGLTHAHDFEDTGVIEPFADALQDYRVGHYYFESGDYEKAISKYQRAISQIPAPMFEQSVDYAVMYWDLGDAQQLAGYAADALDSYQQYLELAGEGASEESVAYVVGLQTVLAHGGTAEVTLLIG